MPVQRKAIQKILKAYANPSTLASHEKFVPGLSKAYGVPMPVLNQLARDFKDGGFELVEELAGSSYIEEKILAAKLLGQIAKKDPEKSFSIFKKMAVQIDNWAVCDTLGMQSLKPLVRTHADNIFSLAKEYNLSSNPWLRRLSLVMVEWYTRDKKHHQTIKKLISHLENDREYYVQKAIKWINRNFSKGR